MEAEPSPPLAHGPRHSQEQGGLGYARELSGRLQRLRRFALESQWPLRPQANTHWKDRQGTYQIERESRQATVIAAEGAEGDQQGASSETNDRRLTDDGLRINWRLGPS